MKLNLHIEGRSKSVTAEIIDKKIWFKIDDDIYSYDLSDLVNSRKKSADSGKSSDKITAPMPGKITKIVVSEGQQVNKGDTLLVMEAMKMEYTLKSDLSATVEKVSAKSGDQVVLGQLLVKLSKKKE